MFKAVRPVVRWRGKGIFFGQDGNSGMGVIRGGTQDNREVSSLEPVAWLERALGTGFSHTEISEVLCGNGVPLPPLSPQDAVRIMAKDLVRTRRYVRKFVLMRANIQAVSLKIQTLKSNNSMAQAMKGVTKAMGTMNRQVRLSHTLP